jgi:hypothetical protein
MFFQGRGNGQGAGTLAERDDTGIIGSAQPFCPDSVSVALNTDSFEHINKCGPVDTPDFRGIKSSKAEITLRWVAAEDKMFAIATLGTVSAGGAGTVTAEQLPANIPPGFVWNLGGLSPHQNITSLVFTPSMTLNTDYTLDAVNGTVTFVTDQSGSPAGPTAAYGYTDTGSVSMLTAGQKEYFFRFKFINKANANAPGTLEFYRVRFDPASVLDFMSDELQSFELKGSVLTDQTRAVDDTEFGQFGRRVL